MRCVPFNRNFRFINSHLISLFVLSIEVSLTICIFHYLIICLNFVFADLLPPIHETLSSFRQSSSLLNETTILGNHRHRFQNQVTVEERSPDNFERNQQQHLAAQPPVTSKNTTVMQDVCSGSGSDGVDNDTVYTQQQITMVSNAEYIYSRRQQLPTTEQPNSMNAYHQGSHTVFILTNSKKIASTFVTANCM